jgi:phosphatidylethanolamine N-methyltransferase
LFRGLVDVILLNDFVSYIIFAVAYFEWPSGVTVTQLGGFDILRLVGGVFILWINVWVKIDALRVIGDYAWCKLPRPFDFSI